MNRQVAGTLFLGVISVVAVATSPQLLDVVWCIVIVHVDVAVEEFVILISCNYHSCSCSRSCRVVKLMPCNVMHRSVVYSSMVWYGVV